MGKEGGGTSAVFRQQISIILLPPPRTKLSQGTGHTPGDLEGSRSKRGFFPFGWGGEREGKRGKGGSQLTRQVTGSVSQPIPRQGEAVGVL